jgi:hypothetical protein
VGADNAKAIDYEGGKGEGHFARETTEIGKAYRAQEIGHCIKGTNALRTSMRYSMAHGAASRKHQGHTRLAYGPAVFAATDPLAGCSTLGRGLFWLRT